MCGSAMNCSVQVRPSHQPSFEHYIPDRPASPQRVTRDLAGRGIPDYWTDSRGVREGARQVVCSAIDVGRDAVDAEFPKNSIPGCQVAHAHEQTMGNDGLESIELKLATFGGDAHGEIVPH